MCSAAVQQASTKAPSHKLSCGTRPNLTHGQLWPRQPSAMVLGFQLCLLWFPDCEHSGFQNLHVANGGEDRTVHGRFGINADMRPSQLIPRARGGGCKYPYRRGEANGRRSRAAWVDCFSNHTPLEWRRAPTVGQRFPSKAYRPRNGLKSPPD